MDAVIVCLLVLLWSASVPLLLLAPNSLSPWRRHTAKLQADIIVNSVVIGLMYMAYPDDCRHTLSSLPRLRPYPTRGHWLLSAGLVTDTTCELCLLPINPHAETRERCICMYTVYSTVCTGYFHAYSQPILLCAMCTLKQQVTAMWDRRCFLSSLLT